MVKYKGICRVIHGKTACFYKLSLYITDSAYIYIVIIQYPYMFLKSIPSFQWAVALRCNFLCCLYKPILLLFIAAFAHFTSCKLLLLKVDVTLFCRYNLLSINVAGRLRPPLFLKKYFKCQPLKVSLIRLKYCFNYAKNSHFLLKAIMYFLHSQQHTFTPSYKNLSYEESNLHPVFSSFSNCI